MTMLKSTSRRRGRRRVQAEENSESWAPAEDWTAITVGSTVDVGISAFHSYVGRVDAKTPDSSIVWVVSAAGQGRQMFGHRDGVRLRIAAGGTA
jgi:hypothetical protein